MTLYKFKVFFFQISGVIRLNSCLCLTSYIHTNKAQSALLERQKAFNREQKTRAHVGGCKC